MSQQVSDSTKRASSGKPAKPYPDFPLFPHATRRWAKKIRGRLIYFGPWDDPDGALKRYLHEYPFLREGIDPPAPDEQSLTCRDLANRFLTARSRSLDSGEITPRTFADLKGTLERFLRIVGKQTPVAALKPSHFAAFRHDRAKAGGVFHLRGEVVRTRQVFRWAHENGLIPALPKYGSEFRPPTAKSLRQARTARGPRLYQDDELRVILQEAPPWLKAAVLLGLNCGFGPTDVSRLPLKAYRGEWLSFGRPKTGMPRKAWLWPETRKAIDEYLATRPKNDEPQLFLRPDGRPMETPRGDSLVSDRFGDFMDDLSFKRDRLGFYAMRRWTETVGSESMDQPAVNLVMGHVDDSMASVYREHVSDARVKRVCEHMRSKLFNDSEAKNA